MSLNWRLATENTGPYATTGGVARRQLVGRLLLALACGLAPGGDARGDDARPDNGGWTPLFNGKNLDGFDVWLTEVPGAEAAVFTVHDGVVHVYRDVPAGAAVPMGVFVTDKEYSHYHLRFQYKWGGKKFAPRTEVVRDSGLLYHVADRVATWPTSVECQVQEGDTGDVFTVGTRVDSTVVPLPKPPDKRAADVQYRAEGGKVQTVGARNRVERVIKSATHEVDGWNTVEVIVRGSDSAVHIVNGHENNRVTNIRRPVPNPPKEKESPDDWAPLTRGRIAFQAEGAEIEYRNIEIKLLADGQSERPAG